MSLAFLPIRNFCVADGNSLTFGSFPALIPIRSSSILLKNSVESIRLSLLVSK